MGSASVQLFARYGALRAIGACLARRDRSGKQEIQEKQPNSCHSCSPRRSILRDGTLCGEAESEAPSRAIVRAAAWTSAPLVCEASSGGTRASPCSRSRRIAEYDSPVGVMFTERCLPLFVCVSWGVWERGDAD